MKKHFFVLLFFFTSLVISHAFQFWWMDTNVPGNNIERVYFFRDRSAFEQASGISVNSINWSWNRNVYQNSFMRPIFEEMNSSGLPFAFIMWEDRTWLPSSIRYNYMFFMLSSDDRTLVASITFPRRIQF